MNEDLNKSKKKRDMLEIFANDIPEFDAESYIVNNDDLPKREENIVNYDEIIEGFKEDAKKIIETICKNYITSKKVYNTSKTEIIRTQQISKLSDLYFINYSNKEIIIKLKDTINSGDLSPEYYKLLTTYQTDIKSTLDSISKHVKEVEEYWLKLAKETLGVNTTAEIQAQESDENLSSSNKPESTKSNVMSNSEMNDKIREAVNKKASS